MTVYSRLASPKATRAVLDRWGLRTHKGFGQHFLIDDGLLGKMIRLADLTRGDRVLEIGPGIGTLTLALLQSGSEVMAIEKDSRLPQAVLESCGNNERLTLICSDALSPEAIAAAASFAPNKLVANLPYAVAASLVLEHLICVQAIDSVIVMVQREVAERMMAEPGRGDYGAYTVKLRLLAKPGAHFSVPRQCFSPPPRVDSTVLRLDRNPARISPELYAATAFMADAAFAQRRKTMQNSASAYFSLNGEDPSLVGGLLQAAGVPHGCRGEVLSVERFIALGEALLAAKGQWPPFQAPCVNGV